MIRYNCPSEAKAFVLIIMLTTYVAFPSLVRRVLITGKIVTHSVSLQVVNGGSQSGCSS